MLVEIVAQSLNSMAKWGFEPRIPSQTLYPLDISTLCSFHAT